MEEKLLSSKGIIDRAMADYRPYAVVLMLSGGDDSITALHVAKALGVPVTHIMHGITGTGIQETTDFVRRTVANESPLYIEANAGNSYLDYVTRKGFFGVGNQAHKFSYHILKWTHFRRTISVAIRQRKRNRNILFVNGARRQESENRMKTMINPIQIKSGAPSNIWVNIINEWDKKECLDFLQGNSIERNPVSVNLCRSGECMCGTMQTAGDRTEAEYFYPKWGLWLKGIEVLVREKGFNWGWGENMPKKLKPTQEMTDFQPMCTGCKVNYGLQKELF